MSGKEEGNRDYSPVAEKTELPVLPSVVAQVVRMAADPECTIQELGAVIRSDPVFAGNVLKAVNSPLYALRTKITSVDHAISFMGIRAVRNLVLCLGIRELTPISSPYPLKVFWEASLRRACAASVLADHMGLPNHDELFTIALCQDLGVLVLIQQSEELAREMASLATAPNRKRLKLEKEKSEGHDAIGRKIFQSWGLPASFAQVIGDHHAPGECVGDYDEMCKICSVAEDIADSFFVHEDLSPLSHAMEGFTMLGLENTSLGEVTDEVGRQVKEAAEMLNLEAKEQPDYAEIVDTASKGLIELNATYEEITEKLKQALEEQKRLARRLEESNKELKQLSLTDPLTKLPNRRAMDEVLDKEIAFLARHGGKICVAMLDIDHFKRFNDEHGHDVGDLVLKKVAEAITGSLRTSDFAARYGGEEFLVVLRNTDLKNAVTAAERIRKAVEKTSVRSKEADLRVTVSIGVAEVKDPNHPRAKVLALRAADDALYNAKESGRNQVEVAE